MATITERLRDLTMRLRRRGLAPYAWRLSAADYAALEARPDKSGSVYHDGIPVERVTGDLSTALLHHAHAGTIQSGVAVVGEVGGGLVFKEPVAR